MYFGEHEPRISNIDYFAFSYWQAKHSNQPVITVIIEIFNQLNSTSCI